MGCLIVMAIHPYRGIKRVSISDTYRITVTTKSGETHEGLMNRSQA